MKKKKVFNIKGTWKLDLELLKIRNTIKLSGFDKESNSREIIDKYYKAIDDMDSKTLYQRYYKLKWKIHSFRMVILPVLITVAFGLIITLGYDSLKEFNTETNKMKSALYAFTDKQLIINTEDEADKSINDTMIIQRDNALKDINQNFKTLIIICIIYLISVAYSLNILYKLIEMKFIQNEYEMYLLKPIVEERIKKNLNYKTDLNCRLILTNEKYILEYQLINVKEKGFVE